MMNSKSSSETLKFCEMPIAREVSAIDVTLWRDVIWYIVFIETDCVILMRIGQNIVRDV